MMMDAEKMMSAAKKPTMDSKLSSQMMMDIEYSSERDM